MAATFVVTLREGFEAALLLGIVYACLDRFGARQHYRLVTLGGALGLVASILMAIAVTRLSGPLLDLGPDLVSAAVIFAAAYLLWAIQRILFNPLDKPENEHVADLNRRELLTMVPLVAAIIWLGVYPAPVLRRMQLSAERFVNVVQGRVSTPIASARVRF